MWGSVSNDEQMFPDPTNLDIDRRNKRAHYSFGMGLHHCVGHFLARAEVQTAVTRWLQEFESVELAQPAEDIHYAPIFGFRALEKLPLRIKRRA